MRHSLTAQLLNIRIKKIAHKLPRMNFHDEFVAKNEVGFVGKICFCRSMILQLSEKKMKVTTKLCGQWYQMCACCISAQVSCMH